MSEFKKGQEVKATTVKGATQYHGKVAEVRNGPKGAWYTIKPFDGSPMFCTRAAKMKPA